ncbi:hypothetical protein MAR_024569, partial [Mya arenaria]
MVPVLVLIPHLISPNIKTLRGKPSAYAHIGNLLQQDHTSPNVFWNCIKPKKEDNFSVSSLKKERLAFTDGKQKAEILNDQFNSVFTKEHMSPKPHMAPGQGKIHTILLKLASAELYQDLAKLFQLSLDQ